MYTVWDRADEFCDRVKSEGVEIDLNQVHRAFVQGDHVRSVVDRQIFVSIVSDVLRAACPDISDEAIDTATQLIKSI